MFKKCSKNVVHDLCSTSQFDLLPDNSLRRLLAMSAPRSQRTFSPVSTSALCQKLLMTV